MSLELKRLHLASLRVDGREWPVHGFVVTHPGGAVLVDTGVGENDEIIREWKVVNRHAADALAEHDLSPADVRIVINTHLHFDHCGQNAVFKHAPFYVQRAELERGRREEDTTREWFDFADARFELIDGDAEVADGVRVVATPGHTAGHQSVVVDTGDGSAVMIGDAAYTASVYEAADASDPGIWDGQYSDAGAWTASLQKVHALRPGAVHFCHDTTVLGRHS